MRGSTRSLEEPLGVVSGESVARLGLRALKVALVGGVRFIAPPRAACPATEEVTGGRAPSRPQVPLEDGWTPGQAAEVRQERIVDVRRHGLRSPGRVTFEEFAGRFRRDHLPTRGLKRNTIANWNTSLDKHLIPALGRYRLGELERRPDLIERFVAKLLTDGLAPKTVRNELVNLRRMLSVAVRWKLIRTNPA